ncbi:hypothetical protein [Antarctobacter jejuensis]|uniref:hypothetical protein n=1 Tax=Antarctobacter jejuensis TaxID=1439938 RepID=UPI003FD52168
MRRSRFALTFFAVLSVALPALAWDTPERGTALRNSLMDAARPHAEWVLGAPVTFVVDGLRVSGDVAFASLHPVRPGGREITPGEIPQRFDQDNPFDWGGADMQVLYQRSGATWVAVHHVIGATDVWWSHPDYCPLWHPVIPEFCGG